MDDFRSSFFDGEVELYAKTSYLSVFDGWLSRQDFDLKIKNASLELVGEYNSCRKRMFKRFYHECFFLNQEDKQYYEFSDEAEFVKILGDNLDYSENFLLVSKKNNYAIQTGYDFTDNFYFLDDSLKHRFENTVRQDQIFIF